MYCRRRVIHLAIKKKNIFIFILVIKHRKPRINYYVCYTREQSEAHLLCSRNPSPPISSDHKVDEIEFFIFSMEELSVHTCTMSAEALP
jgi:hypothetical protein